MSEPRTIGCEEALKHLLAYLDRELKEGTHQEVQQHLNRCRSCFSRAEFEEQLKKQLLEVGEESVPSSLQERIKSILKRF